MLDAAYDSSPRDLCDNWIPITASAVLLVIVTVACVARVAHALDPAMGWWTAIVLGTIVAPPDASAASPCCGRCGRRIACG
ncbi:MAG TPA: hypothetical protein VHS58_09200 [Acetobacteraceae bacterium]|nr:hypothetical protein [Acetobacteraceae bacterium]